MDKLFSRIKQNKYIKRIRIWRGKRYAKRLMFSRRAISYLEKHPEQISKKIYCHIKKHPKEFIDLNNKLETAIKLSKVSSCTPLKKNQIKKDMLYWYLAYGYSIGEYLCYEFVNKSIEERRLFYSDRESVCLAYDLNDIDAMKLFLDKMKTYNKFEKYFHRKAIAISESKDFEQFKNFIKLYRKFFKKNVFESCGRSIELINVDEDTRTEIELFKYLISEGKVILEERVIQSAEMNIFNPTSVNTVRCITVNIKGEINVPYCFMKTGRNGAVIDNGAAGGILVGVDSCTGVLGTQGVDEFNRRYEMHPDSNIVFKGYQLPKWDEMIGICKEMALSIPQVRLIGWDMAYTEGGWVLIEGNAMTEVIGPQSTWLRGIRNDIIKFYNSV